MERYDSLGKSHKQMSEELRGHPSANDGCPCFVVVLPWLYASHAARHTEGRGYGREDRDGGLNDEAPYLSFLFIHDFSFRLRV